ncbi:MAG: hypothetical protein M1823_006176 [Watsoniomyces obsoletus]|nr:MAG: hypothetical protein M1823_006176 [Watsoniomyces obsoletus]
MARASSASSRNLSLTEELEKFEQSITLTLQGSSPFLPRGRTLLIGSIGTEIDHNFSRAHHIVTTSILPVVERYAEHSKEVWEGSKFWKEFFEASANVSLTGYEDRGGGVEQAEEDEEGQDQVQNENAEEGDDEEESYVETTVLSSTQQHTMTGNGDPSDPHDTGGQADSPAALHSPSIINSTPRPKSTKATKTRTITQPTFAEFPSPYEALKREHEEMLSARPGIGVPQPPGSPTVTSKLPAISRVTPGGQPPARNRPGAGGGGGGGARGGDVLLHRVLDKTYRIQATPHKTPASQIPRRGVQSRPLMPAKSVMDSSPMSSPDVARPELNPDVFSPLTRRNATMTAGASKKMRTPKPEYKQGVSVLQTPRQGYGGGGIATTQEHLGHDDEEDDEDDDWGEIEGMSPPKTIQFAVPASRLLRTPAREASKRIVSDLLMTAGANSTITTDNDLPSFDLQLRTRALKNHPHDGTLDLDGPDVDFDEQLDGGEHESGKDAYGRRIARAGNEDNEADELEDDEEEEDDYGEATEPTSPVLVKGRSGTALIEDTF